MRRLLLTLALLLAASGTVLAQLPGDSLYQLQPQLLNQDGKAVGLDLYRGQPTLISMFYGSCPHVCPMLIAKIRYLEGQLPATQRQRMRVLLVSLDPERDSPAKLRELAGRHGVDLARWTFAQAPEADVRRLAAALGIRYRKLPDGEFNHSTVITLLDPAGRASQRSSSLAVVDAELLAALRAATGE